MDQIEQNNIARYCRDLYDIIDSGIPIPDQVNKVIQMYNHMTDKQRVMIMHYMTYALSRTIKLHPKDNQDKILDTLFDFMVREGNE